VLNRRDLLKLAAMAPAGAATASTLLSCRAAADGKASPEIRRYRTLGKTGQKVSDLSMGGGSLSGPSVIRRALEIGVTYFDTAPDYGESEKTIGAGWRSAGVSRDKFHITTKICRPGGYPGHAPPRSPEKKIIQWVEGSLRRLRTDYVDNLFVHALGERGPKDIERLKDPEMLAAVDKLKKQGKVRFLGCSSHGPHKPLECLRYAVESGHYDVIMPAYNIYKWPGLDAVLELARAKGVGVIAMKTLRGGKQARARGVLPKGPFEHAAFKWVWSNEAVAGLVVTMRSVSQLEDYARASGGKLAATERAELTRMAALTSDSVCRIGCGDCMSRCSMGVSIPSVFRHDMYYTDYADVAKAKGEYADLLRIGASAAACLGCSNQTCVGACPHGVPIRDGMIAAHGRLA
jgi:predicted aldo/keto reductase-like oxidoreductase